MNNNTDAVRVIDEEIIPQQDDFELVKVKGKKRTPPAVFKPQYKGSNAAKRAYKRGGNHAKSKLGYNG